MPASLYPKMTRERSERVVAGVAAGAARHLGLDVKWVRLFFVAASFAGGFGALLYAALWMFVPLSRTDEPVTRQRLSPVNVGLVALGFAGALIALQVSSGAGATVVFVLGVLIVGAVIALQAYDRGTGTAANVAALTLGAVLIIAGALAVAVLGESAGVAGVVVSVLVTVVGVAVLVVPLIVKLANSLVAEREAKAVADQRAEIASRLHDSVLQTLALIQKEAGDEAAVTRLAHSQERELRAWLFDDATPNHTTTFAALQKAAGEVEDMFGVVIQPVTVGEDVAFDERTEAVVLAAREAMVNAAKHAGVDTIDVYAEHLAGELTVFVRDRGTGFDVGAIPEDRHGVRDSIIGRVEKAGGRVGVESSPSNGSEIELALTL
ncbi:ATP-binding protein [Corynebacterium jeddahense]|uniref:ATP-binding protein n=3 Tax=Corynebacterium jeddahense TaxID=1414719 RepID=UPI002358E106|nr:ATP-binding protein [Corynebacterium jeddahense]